METTDLVIPVVVAVMMGIKQIPIFTETRRWVLPWVAVLLGIGASLMWAEPGTTWQVSARLGLIYGLSASGLYDGIVSPTIARLGGGK